MKEKGLFSRRIINDNRGQITVFLCLILVVLMGLVIAVLQVEQRRHAQIKVVTATSCAASSALADYNSYIFDRYHVLVLDKTYNGAGEGKLEEVIKGNLEENLENGDLTGFSVETVVIAGETGILDNEAEEFKEQIRDNFKYDVIEYAFDKVLEAVDGKDNPVSAQDEQKMDADIEKGKKEGSNAEGNGNDNSEEENTEIIAAEGNDPGEGNNTGEGNSSEENVSGEESASKEGGTSGGKSLKDPRKQLKQICQMGVAGLIKPDSVELSEEELNLKELSSYDYTHISIFEGVDYDFSDYKHLKQDLNKTDNWLGNLRDNAEAVMYASKYFNSAVSNEYDDTVLNLEKEYIICGKKSDAENYKGTVDRLLALRFAMNFAYLITDTGRVAETESLAVLIEAFTGIPADVTKYLLVGCWAYAEGIADIYCLLRGEEVAFVKSDSTWKTDYDGMFDMITGSGQTNISSGNNSISSDETKTPDNNKEDTASDSDKDGASGVDGSDDDSDDDSDDEFGELDYDQYLMILIAINSKNMYYRMLDLIEVNTRQEYQNFSMQNAITEFGVNVTVSYAGNEISVRKEIGY